MTDMKTLPKTPLDDAWAMLNDDSQKTCGLNPLLRNALRQHINYLETKLGSIHATVQMCLTINMDSSPEEAILWLDKQWEKEDG